MNYFQAIGAQFLSALNSFGGVKEGGSVQSAAINSDLNPSLVKKTYKRIIYVVPTSVATGTAIAEIDCDGFESITLFVLGGGASTSINTYMGDTINNGNPYSFTYVGTEYAPFTGPIIQSINGSGWYKGNKRGRFLRIRKETGSSTPGELLTLVVYLHQEVWVESNLGILSNPNAVQRSIITSLTSSAAQTLFTAKSSRSRYNLRELSLTNTLETATTVTISGLNPISLILPAKTTVSRIFEIPPQSAGNSPFQITCADATGGNPIGIYASAYLTLL